MIRSLVAAVLLGLLLAAGAQAKLNPTFSERIAKPGDLLELDVGEGSSEYLGPLRIFLVSLEGDDRPQVKIGELGTPGMFDASRLLRFKVPDVPGGEYTVAVWFKGSETGTWANALEGVNPLLTIEATAQGAASTGGSSSQTSSLLRAAGLGGLALGLVALGWRRANRRQATRAAN